LPVFGYFVMVDWSGGNGRKSQRENCIWIAHGSITDQQPTVLSPHSRTEATTSVRRVVYDFVKRDNGRVLVSFDFPYGYPSGFSTQPFLPPGGTLPPWQRVWAYLSQEIQDDITTPGKHLGVPTNRSNRFAVANKINRQLSHATTLGPFWCPDKPDVYSHIPQSKPRQPFQPLSGVPINEYRITDRAANSDFPFRLFGQGSVGSQMLVGLPRLRQLRFDPQLSDLSAAWPFETGWATQDAIWDLGASRIIHAEIYPSVMKPLHDDILDRGQVRALWQWARDQDRIGLLQNEFAVPPLLTASPADEVLVRTEEGWILGAPR
jgi:precorrin-8X/cobalt-precorrin-8 methylmutase